MSRRVKPLPYPWVHKFTHYPMIKYVGKKFKFVTPDKGLIGSVQRRFELMRLAREMFTDTGGYITLKKVYFMGATGIRIAHRYSAQKQLLRMSWHKDNLANLLGRTKPQDLSRSSVFVNY